MLLGLVEGRERSNGSISVRDDEVAVDGGCWALEQRLREEEDGENQGETGEGSPVPVVDTPVGASASNGVRDGNHQKSGANGGESPVRAKSDTSSMKE